MMDTENKNKDNRLDMNLAYYAGMRPDREFFMWRFRTLRLKRIIGFFGQSVLDVGCGMGYELEHLRDEYGKNIAGLDANAQVLEALKKKGIECYASFEAVDKQFDTVYTSHVIEHISPGRIYQFAGDIFSKLKPGGTWVIISPISKWFWDQPDHYRKYDRPAIQTLFRDTGLEEVYSEYTGSQNFACNVLRPIRKRVFSNDWSLHLFYQVSKVSKRDLVMVGRKKQEE